MTYNVLSVTLSLYTTTHMFCHKVHLICLCPLVCGAILVCFDLTVGLKCYC